MNAQFKGLIEKGIGLVPIPYEQLFGGVSKAVYAEVVKSRYSEIGDWLSQRAASGGGSAEQDARSASDEHAVEALLRQMTLSAAIDHANAGGVKVKGEIFAVNGRILSADKLVKDPKKVERFVQWCEDNDFPAPRLSQDLKSAVNGSHDDAVNSFNSINPGERGP